jgi:hypothetical protein
LVARHAFEYEYDDEDEYDVVAAALGNLGNERLSGHEGCILAGPWSCKSERVGRNLRPRRDPLPFAELIGVAHCAMTEATTLTSS